jgi:hypothetical protein
MLREVHVKAGTDLKMIGMIYFNNSAISAGTNNKSSIPQSMFMFKF